ncbi:MAG: hypothetical protein TEF_19960 [Rhizobiales bacterium NRL2]|jgi:hypothetical protein|nr:MAG: hypothetical protein TEF_19960 [Rhizobiales bacterium NRL2]
MTEGPAKAGGGFWQDLSEVPRRFPWPFAIAAGTALWLVWEQLFNDGPPWILTPRMVYGIFLGCLVSFFVTLGLARLGERAPHLKRRLAILAAAVPAPAILVCMILVSVDFAFSLGLRWAETAALQRAQANAVALHLVAAGVVAAFVLPYAAGRVGNDRFIWWTIASIFAGFLGLFIAGLALAVLMAVYLGATMVAGIDPEAEVIGVFATVALCLFWPWYALSELPRIDRRDPTEVPPTPRWFRLAAHWIVLPGWLALAAIAYAGLGRWLFEGGENVPAHAVAALVAAGGLATAICYATALRHAGRSTVMARWRRWMGAVLIAPVAVGLYAVTWPAEHFEESYIGAFALTLLLWLLGTSLYVTWRAEPRAPRLATGFVAAMLAGIAAAFPVTSTYLAPWGEREAERRAEAGPLAERNYRPEQWSEGGMPLEVLPGLWAVTRMIATVRGGSGPAGFVLPGADAARLTAELDETGLEIRLGACRVALLPTAALLAAEAGANPVYRGRFGDIDIAVRPLHGSTQQTAAAETLQHVDFDLYLRRGEGPWPGQAPCPPAAVLEPVRP